MMPDHISQEFQEMSIGGNGKVISYPRALFVHMYGATFSTSMLLIFK
jgi:hypothetical protein